MLISRYWSPAPKAIEEKHKQLLPVCPKTALERKKKKGYLKAFCVTRKRNEYKLETKNKYLFKKKKQNTECKFKRQKKILKKRKKSARIFLFSI